MDPISQGAVGMIATQSVASNSKTKLAALVGFLAGTAADLDVLIKSDADPLFGLFLHRHFTHSLFFIPFGAFFVAISLWSIAKIFKNPLPFNLLYIFSFIGFATHGLLDATTSYGTVLLWPMSSSRIAWDWIAIIDVLFTLPILVFIGLTLWLKNRNYARAGMLYALFYFALLAFNQNAVFQAYLGSLPQEAKASAQKNVRLIPRLFQPFSYRGVYRHEGRIYISSLQSWPFYETQITHHGSVPHTTPQDIQNSFNVTPALQKQLNDYEWFANGFIGTHKKNPLILADYRYGNFGQPKSPLWGIEINLETQSASPLSLRKKLPGELDK